MGVAPLGIAAAVVALVVRFIFVGDASLTYNEATYAEMTRHPWVSSFYPDDVFLRHPPFSFALLATWAAVFGDAEWVLRLPALAATVAGSWLLWDGTRRQAGPEAGVLVGLVLAAAYPLHAYALQVGMYPYAFLWMALAVWAHALGRVRLERWALVLFALTHLFGFLFLALHIALRPDAAGAGVRLRAVPDIVRDGVRTWPAWLWLAAAGILGILVNAEGDIMRLGPLGQAIRGAATAGDTADRPLVHVTSAAIAYWCLNLGLAWAAWRRRGSWAAWTVGIVLLLAYLPFAAPFPRYVLLILPPVFVMGVIGLRRMRPAWTAIAVVLALSSIPAGYAYLEHGPDPRAAGDVPGVQDWQAAVNALPVQQDLRVATSGPTATAYYLDRVGYEITDRQEGPYTLRLTGPENVTVLRMDSSAATVQADAWIVPVGWQALHARLAGAGLGVCAEPTGLRVYHEDC